MTVLKQIEQFTIALNIKEMVISLEDAEHSQLMTEIGCGSLFDQPHILIGECIVKVLHNQQTRMLVEK